MNKNDYILGWEKFPTGGMDVWKRNEKGTYHRKHRIDNNGQVWDEDPQLNDDVSEEDVKKRYNKIQYMDENEMSSIYFENFLNDHKKFGRLHAKWSVDLEQDLKNLHGINIENEMRNIMSYEIQKEIDNDIINTLLLLLLHTPLTPLQFREICVQKHSL